MYARYTNYRHLIFVVPKEIGPESTMPPSKADIIFACGLLCSEPMETTLHLHLIYTHTPEILKWVRKSRAPNQNHGGSFPCYWPPTDQDWAIRTSNNSFALWTVPRPLTHSRRRLPFFQTRPEQTQGQALRWWQENPPSEEAAWPVKLTAVAAAAAAGSRNTAPASSSGAAGSGKKKKKGRPRLGIGGASRMGGPTESSNRRAEKLDLWAVPTVSCHLKSQLTGTR